MGHPVTQMRAYGPLLGQLVLLNRDAVTRPRDTPVGRGETFGRGVGQGQDVAQTRVGLVQDQGNVSVA